MKNQDWNWPRAGTAFAEEQAHCVHVQVTELLSPQSRTLWTPTPLPVTYIHCLPAKRHD